MAMTKSQKMTLGVLSAIAGLALLLLYTRIPSVPDLEPKAARPYAGLSDGMGVARHVDGFTGRITPNRPSRTPHPRPRYRDPGSPFLSCNDLPP
jgi:hypothetical protein